MMMIIKMIMKSVHLGKEIKKKNFLSKVFLFKVFFE